MNEFCGGNQRAFDLLFTRFHSRLHGFLRPMVKNDALAEDLLQSTFLSVIRSRDRWDPSTTVAPWLFAIAANAARDSLRRSNRGIEQLATSPTEPQPDAPVAPSVGDPGLRKELNDALEALPAQQREAVILHKVQGLSFEEIAEALGTTSLAVRLRAHRGYETLRTKLKHLEGF